MMIDAILTELILCVYCISDVIEFTTLTDNNGQKYLKVIMTEDGVDRGNPLYFRWNQIPSSIFTIYKYSKQYSKTLYDENTNICTIYGTHIGRKDEKEYILAKITPEYYHTYISFDYSHNSSFQDKDYYDVLVDNMIETKKLLSTLKRGPIIVAGA